MSSDSGGFPRSSPAPRPTPRTMQVSRAPVGRLASQLEQNDALIAVAVVAMASGVGRAFANADDAAWIKKCVDDNKDEDQTATVVAAYCSCMNNKMSDSETQSITTWEKSHPSEQEAAPRKPAGRANRRSRLWLLVAETAERLLVEVHKLKRAPS
jgi:hypothetical protein